MIDDEDEKEEEDYPQHQNQFTPGDKGFDNEAADPDNECQLIVDNHKTVREAKVRPVGPKIAFADDHDTMEQQNEDGSEGQGVVTNVGYQSRQQEQQLDTRRLEQEDDNATELV